MTETVKDILIALSGLGIGVIFMIIAGVIQRKVGRKMRVFDERQQQISNQAKAFSWNVTLIVLLIAWAVVIIVDGISFAFFLMAAIYILHCLSLIATTLYYNHQNT
ncbi:DUF2178 domain-containing protein [Rossellomorea vietnamensis]|uniref:DUF2178 domain-containing protein n=1 Tax=Rossellomorea vietnamensis TaxID=218284 RepID=A0A5D4MC01_9BACI|nr:DUF2178 domain-containing protein [Rossellomorea vietnamensis]TYR99252.1 DUF2178 domain-containing protein [Rossellomorea vietnamensis]